MRKEPGMVVHGLHSPFSRLVQSKRSTSSPAAYRSKLDITLRRYDIGRCEFVSEIEWDGRGWARGSDSDTAVAVVEIVDEVRDLGFDTVHSADCSGWILGATKLGRVRTTLVVVCDGGKSGRTGISRWERSIVWV
jgi:hypothetical protein